MPTPETVDTYYESCEFHFGIQAGPPVSLGIFTAKECFAPATFNDPVSGFQIEERQPYLGLHLPPVPQGLRSLGHARQSLAMVGEYAAQLPSKPSYVIATPIVEGVAWAAQRRFGFGRVDVGEAALAALEPGLRQRLEALRTHLGNRALPPLLFRETASLLAA